MFKIDTETNIMSITRKDTAIFDFSLDNYTLGEGDKLTFTVAKEVDLPAEEALINVEITQFVDGVATIIIDSKDTDIEPGTYLYDIQVSTKDGRVDTVIGPAKFKITGGVSH